MPMLPSLNRTSARLSLTLMAASSGLLFYSHVPAMAQASLAESIQEIRESERRYRLGPVRLDSNQRLERRAGANERSARRLRRRF